MLARMIVSRALPRWGLCDATDVRIVDVWRSSCGVVVLWHPAHANEEFAETTSISLSIDAKNELCKVLDI